MLKLITSIYQKTPLREWKGKPQNGESYCYHTLLKTDKKGKKERKEEGGREEGRDWHLKCIKNSYKSVRKVWTTQWRFIKNSRNCP